MLKDTALEAALKTAPLSLFEGTVTRFQFEAFRRGVMPKGSYDHGGRYNEPGTHAIYTSFSRSCAFEEFTQNWLDDQPMSAASMLSLYVKLQRVLDLTDDAVLTALDTTRDEICRPMRRRTGERTQQLGTLAASLRVDGIIAPSRLTDKNNLVIFPDSHLLPPYRVIVRVGTR